MSFFGKLFGGKKEEAPTTSDAIQKLRETQDLLAKKQEYLEKQIDDLTLVAKKNASKNKRGLFCSHIYHLNEPIFHILVIRLSMDILHISKVPQNCLASIILPTL